jgi:hypothetical protein
MKSFKLIIIAMSILGCLAFSVGCETSHTESDKDNMFGGHTHEETTTTHNPVTGDTSTSHTEQKTP